MPRLNRENHSVAKSQYQPFLLKISSGTCARVIYAGTCARMIYAGQGQSGWRNRHSAIQSTNPLPWGPQFLSALEVPGRLCPRSAPLETSLQGLGNLPCSSPPSAAAPTPFSFFHASVPLLPQIPPSPFVLFCSHSNHEPFDGELIYLLEAESGSRNPSSEEYSLFFKRPHEDGPAYP